MIGHDGRFVDWSGGQVWLLFKMGGVVTGQEGSLGDWEFCVSEIWFLLP